MVSISVKRSLCHWVIWRVATPPQKLLFPYSFASFSVGTGTLDKEGSRVHLELVEHRREVSSSRRTKHARENPPGPRLGRGGCTGRRGAAISGAACRPEPSHTGFVVQHDLAVCVSATVYAALHASARCTHVPQGQGALILPMFGHGSPGSAFMKL